MINEIKTADGKKTFYEKLNQYNATVLGIHQFYQIATDVSIDFQKVGLQMERIIYNRLGHSYKITKTGKFETNSEIRLNYEKSKQMRFINERPIIPIAYIKTKPPSSKVQTQTPYSVVGKALMSQEVEKGVNLTILRKMMAEEIYDNRIEYHDNRISKYCSQKGKCAITHKELEMDDIHCHHKLPISMGGTDEYDNLIIISKAVHTLIHAKKEETINSYLHEIANVAQLKKLNNLRRRCGLKDIEATL